MTHQLNMGRGTPVGLNGQGLNRTFNQGMASPMGDGMNNSLGQGMNGANMMGRQPLQRTNSFAMGGQPAQIRTVGDFHAIQRSGSDVNPMTPLGLSNMGPEMDFNTLPR